MKRLLALFLLLPLLACAAPFAEWLQVPVPGGGTVAIWGEGDEYDAYFETEDGHALRSNFATGRYEYVTRDEGTKAYAGTGVFLGDEAGNEALLASIPLHLRDESAAHDAEVQARIDALEAELHTQENWEKVRDETERRNEILAKIEAGDWDGPQPTSVTLGTIRGLTILLDFPVTNGAGQVTGSLLETKSPNITPAVVDGWFNREEPYDDRSYSVRKFYQISSEGQLEYTNAVIGPFTVPRPREYYDNGNKSYGVSAREMICDVLDVIKAQPDFQTRYMPLFRQLSVNGSGYGKALNVIYAGPKSPTWSVGLWPHRSTLSYSGITWQNDSGRTCRFYNYNIVEAGNSPDSISTTLHHENGHMVCDFPDLYHSKSSQSGGVGNLSLMCYHGSSDIDPYLRAGAGWFTPKELPSSGWVTVTGARSDAWKFRNPSRSNEYFLIENRRRKEMNKGLSGDGIVIWRCYGGGNNFNATRLSQYNTGHPATNRWNNELSCEQADGLYNYERGSSWTDSNDFWFKGNTASLYGGRFDDDTAACARWYDGTRSGLVLSHFTESSDAMRFLVGDPSDTPCPISEIRFVSKTRSSATFTTKVESFGKNASSVDVYADFYSDASATTRLSTTKLGTVTAKNTTQTWTASDLAPGTPWYVRLRLANAGGGEEFSAEVVCVFQPLDPVRYVRAGATGAGNGTSWADAFPDLQSALAFCRAMAAVYGEPCYDLWVAAGTYKPGAAASASFETPPGARILGGFAGDETDAADRDWIANPTVLSGELGDPSSVADNVKVLVKGPGGAETALWDGFVFTRAGRTALDCSNGKSSGGNDVALVADHCLFVDNHSSGDYYPSVAYGPCYLRNSVLTGNTYNYAYTYSGILRTVNLDHCSVFGNTCTGGPVSYEGSFRNTAIWGNSVSGCNYHTCHNSYYVNSSSDRFAGYGSKTWIGQNAQVNFGGRINHEPGFATEPETGLECGLSSSSYAVDKGTVLDWMDESSLDYLGNPRVGGSAPDIGAIEYVEQGPTAPRFSSVSLGEITYQSVEVAATLRSLGNQSTSASLVAQVSPNANFSTIVATGTAVSATETKVAYTVSAAGLSDGTTYYVRVKATGSNGLYEFSEALSFTTADRSIPSGSVALGTPTLDTIPVTWRLTNVGYGNSSATVTILYGTTTACTQSKAIGTYTAETSGTATLTGLSPNTTYYVKIKVVASPSNKSFTSDPAVSAKTRDYGNPAVSATAGSASQYAATFTWSLTDFGYGASSATVYVDVSKSSSFPSGSTTTSTLAADVTSTGSSRPGAVSGLDPETTYYVRVRAVNDGGKAGTSATMTFATKAVGTPAAAVSVTERLQRGATLRIVVTDLGETANSATVYVDYGTTTSYGTTKTAGTLSEAGTLDYQITELESETDYCVRVRVVNNGGKTGSATATFRTLEPNDPAFTLSVSASYTSASFAANVTRIGEGATSAAGYVRWGASSALSPELGRAPFGRVASVPADVSAAATGLSAGTTYYYEAVITNNITGRKAETGSFSTKTAGDLAWGEGYYEGGLLQGYNKGLNNQQWGLPVNKSAAEAARWNSSGYVASFAYGAVASYQVLSTSNWTNPYDGATYPMDKYNRMWAYGGQMWMESGVTYWFAVNFYHAASITVDGTVVCSEENGGNGTPQVGSVTPTATGWHDIAIAVGSDGNGAGAANNPWNSGSPFTSLRYGTAWNTNGLSSVTSSNASQWKQLLDAGDRHLFRARGKQAEMAFLDQGATFGSTTMRVPVRLDTMYDNLTLTVYASRSPDCWYFEDRWEKKVVVGSTGAAGAKTLIADFSGIDTSVDWYVSARLADGSKYDQWTDAVKFTPVIVRDPPAGNVSVGTPTFSSNTATANVTSLGDDATSVAVVLEWSTDSGFSSKETADLGSVSAPGSKTRTLSGLAPGTTYYVRAVLTGSPSGLTTTTAAASFTTPAYTAPSIASVTASGTGATKGRVVVDVSSLGQGSSSAAISVYLSTDGVFGSAAAATRTVSATGSQTFDLTGLSASTAYFVKVVVAGSNGKSATDSSATFATDDVESTAWFDVKWGSQGWGSGAAWRTSAGESAAGGSWSVPSGDASSRSGSLLALGLPEGGVLRFTARSPSASKATVKVEGAFTPVLASLPPAAPSGAIAGICFVRGGYKAWNGTQWLALSGATPAAASTAWTATFDWSQTTPRVRYVVGGTALKASGSEWIPLATSQAYVTGVGYSGGGSVGDFKASYTGGGYVAPVLSTLEDGGHVPLAFGKDASNNPTFEVTIKNAVKDAWYTVYASDTVDGTYKAVTSAKATADGLKTLSIPAPSSKPTRFVRIGVSDAQVPSNTEL